MLDSRIVDEQEAKCFAIVDPHGMRIEFEENAVRSLRFVQSIGDIRAVGFLLSKRFKRDRIADVFKIGRFFTGLEHVHTDSCPSGNSLIQAEHNLLWEVICKKTSADWPIL